MIDAALREWFPVIVAALLIGLGWLWQWHRRRPVKDPPEGTPYQIYTTEYDIEIRADDIAGRLAEISNHHPKYWRAEGDPDWIGAVENANRKAQEFAQDGLLAKLPKNLSDFAISILVDHSGSMKGETMQAVASTAKVVTDALSANGAKVELLGFTTAGWQGGSARRKWLERGRPRYPGRLAALMHIVYKAAEDRQLSDAAFHAMLNPGILYENIDGEAIQWAEQRLLTRPEKRKFLVVFSDGAPVDDSTLMQNGPSILYRHIQEVIERLENKNVIELGAVGVNFRVDEYYSNSVSAEDLSEIPSVAVSLLKTLLAK